MAVRKQLTKQNGKEVSVKGQGTLRGQSNHAQRLGKPPRGDGPGARKMRNILMMEAKGKVISEGEFSENRGTEA